MPGVDDRSRVVLGEGGLVERDTEGFRLFAMLIPEATPNKRLFLEDT
jgi:hypothetical protein